MVRLAIRGKFQYTWLKTPRLQGSEDGLSAKLSVQLTR